MVVKLQLSLKDIAPVGRDHEEIDAEAPTTFVPSDSSINKDSDKNDGSEKVQDSADSYKETVEQTNDRPHASEGLSRSTRHRRAPDRWTYE